MGFMAESAQTSSLSELIEGYTLGPFATNCYVVRVAGGDACWFVDASWGAAALVERVKELGLRPEKLLLTHAHPDHIAGVPEVKGAMPDLPVAIHGAEREWLTDATKNLSTALGGEAITVGAADEILEDGQALSLGETEWEVLHTPGHSPGGVSLYCAGLGVVIAGDTLFAGSIGRFDFPSSDEGALFASIREKLYALPDETVVLPGHGAATTVGREKASNPFVRPL